MAMVTQDFAKASDSSVIHHFMTDMGDHSVHSEDLAHALRFDRRNQHTFAQMDRLPPCVHSVGEQFYRSMGLVDPQGYEDPKIGARTHAVDLRIEEDNGFQGVNYGHGQGLSLSLGSGALSDMVYACHYKQRDSQASMMYSHYAAAREDLAGTCFRPAKHSRDEYMFSAVETTPSDYSTNQSFQMTQNIASYADSLQRSRYLKAMQQLLDEAVHVTDVVELGSDKQLRKSFRDSDRSHQVKENQERDRHSVNHSVSKEKRNTQTKITKLVSLMDELESRYEQYIRRMDSVVSSFELIAGRGAATSYTALTIHAMTKHFSNLREAIVAQIHGLNQSLPNNSPKNHRGLSLHETFDQSTEQRRETLQQASTAQVHQVWRPLRGLPETSVAILRAWLFEHFLHPYPNENEKLMLASKTGLTKNQISNWFINARVRLWKPMIEEMYREEFPEDSRDSISS